MTKLLITLTGVFSLLTLGAVFNWKNETEILGSQQAVVFASVEKQTPPPELKQKEDIRGETPHIAGSPSEIAEPIAKFRDRIIKKPFGIYITPKTSPVQPDKFAGYHAGVDIEYGDTVEDVPVRAITNGEIILSKYASGYGGVIVIRHEINGEKILVLYGHLDPKSMVASGEEVKQGETIGVLGDGHSEETDGARKHLHFAILKKNELDIRGYVKNIEELDGWYNPMEFYESN